MSSLLFFNEFLITFGKTGAYMHLKMMFYSEELNSRQFASLLCSYGILHSWALIFGLYFLLFCTVPPGSQHAIHI